MTGMHVLSATIDAFHANIAILDNSGSIIAVNDKWRDFGRHRRAPSDYVGFNYLDVCIKAADRGDPSAARTEAGLRRLLSGLAETYGQAYFCGQQIFRMTARHLNDPIGGIIVAHEDITALLNARWERNHSRRSLSQAEQEYVAGFDRAYEELGQQLAAISLAALAIEKGGDVSNAQAVISMAVEKAKFGLRALRYEVARQRGRDCDDVDDTSADRTLN